VSREDSGPDSAPGVGAATFRTDLPGAGATEAFAAALARLLRPGDVVALSGGLGAGKTTMTRAMASTLGVGAEAGVSSPTFVVVQEYATRDAAIARLVHVDAYRLGGADELDTVGWDRFERGGLAEMGAALVCEWPERIGDALAALGPVARLGLEITGETSRRVAGALPASWRDRPTLGRVTSREPTRCRKTGAWVAPDNPHWPFIDERAQMADLYGWFSESYVVSRAAKDSDLEETE